MAEKSPSKHEPILAPAANANGHEPSDEETAAMAAHSTELKTKKRTKCLVYIVLFTLFQTGIILLFALLFMRIRNPKFRIQSASFVVDTFDVGTEASPTFNLRMDTQFTVKNSNFGHFKYELGTVTFAYNGTPVGRATIPKARARARSTKKVANVRVDLRSTSLPDITNIELGRDISSGVIPLTSYSRLDGKIHLMKVFKKNKSAQMNCTMEIEIVTKTLGNIICK